MNSMKIGTYQMDTTFGLYLPEYTIPAPAVQTNFVKIIGRDGSVDLSNALGLHYDSRTWSLDFKCFDPTVNWHTLSSQVMNAIHGKRLNFEFDDDPNYFWTGRVSVQNYVSNHGTGTLKVTIVSDPFKYAKLSTIVTKTASTGTDYTGSMVTFNDGLIYDLSAEIEPIQDLHGYSHPWPAGGGKNKAKLSADNVGSNQRSTVEYSDSGATITATGTYGRYGWLIPVTVGETYTLSMVLQASNKGTGYNMRVYLGSEDGTWGSGSAGYIGQLNTASTDPESNTFTLTASTATLFVGAYVSNTATDGSLTISSLQLEQGSTATTYSPYSNICPISGRTGVSVYRTGKNLFDKTATNTSNGYVENSFLTSEGAISSNGSINISEYIKVSPSTDFVISGSVTSGMYSPSVCFYDISKNFISGVAYSNRATIAFTTPANAAYLRMSYSKNAIDNYQLELGSTATTYEQYRGNTYAADWTTEAGTVYGGTVDVVTGVLTVDKKYFTQSGDVLLYGNWGYDNAPLYYFVVDNTIPIKVYADAQDDGYILSNYFSATTGYNPDSMKNNEIRTKDNTPDRLYFRWDSAGSLADINAAFAENPLQIVAELATPLTYQLTPQEIEALVGTNNVWSDGGNVTVAVVTPETLINNGRAVVPTLTASADMVLKWGNYSASVQQGTSTIPQLILENGANLIYIIGTGSISFTWQEVRL